MRSILYIASILSVAMIIALPLATGFSLSLGDLSQLGLLASYETLSALRNSLSTAFVSLMVCTPMCLLLAWWTVRTDALCAKTIRRLLIFPYYVPPFLSAVAWITLAAPKVGLINRLWPGLELNVYSWWGLVWVLSLAYFPLLLAGFCRALEDFDPALEEAARVCGAGQLRTFTSVTLPLLIPSILAASFLFLLNELSAFGIPALIGIPGRMRTLTTLIYEHVRMGGLDGIINGFVLSVWLLGLTVLLAVISDRLQRSGLYRLVSGKASRDSIFRLLRLRLPISILLAIVTMVVVLIPMLSMVLSSFLSVAGDLSRFTLRNYYYLFQMPEFGRALSNSLWLSIISTLGCCLLGFLASYFKDRSRFVGRTFLFQLSGLGFALPGAVIALGVVLSYGAGWGVESLALYGSPVLLLIAYCAKYLAMATQSFYPMLGNIDTALDDAVRVFGGNWWTIVRRVLVPLLTPTFFGMIFLIGVPIFSELTMSVLLVGPGTETVGTLLFQLQDYANPLSACSLATLLVLGLSLVLFMSQLIVRRLATC